MIFGQSQQMRSRFRNHPRPYPLGMVLLVCLLLVTVSGQVLAASGSTRLTIHLDQRVVDDIARWRGELAKPPAIPVILPEADRILLRFLPAVKAGLAMTHHPQSAQRILQLLQRDALLVFEGRAEHAGNSGGACVSDATAVGSLTVHSI